MLTAPLIRRLCDHREHDRLLDQLTRNGLPLPLPLRVRLADSPVAAPALALRRLTELTYGPTPASRAITRKLLDHLDAPSPDRDPLGLACVTAALGRVLREHRDRLTPPDARDRAMAGLAALQAPDGSFATQTDRTDEDRLLSSVFILYLLAEDTRFRKTIRLADLLSFIEPRIAAADDATDELWQMTRLILRPLPATRFTTPATPLAA